MELQGKYTIAKIHAITIEEEVISQMYDIINCKAFDKKIVRGMSDIHVGASGPCGLVAEIGDYICPEHIGVDIGCEVSMLELNTSIQETDYILFEHKVKQQIPMGMTLHEKSIINNKNFQKFLTLGFNKYRQLWPEMLNELPEIVTENWISKTLKRVGMDEGVFYKSLGTLGGGNHFLEYGEGDGHSAFFVHCGSRNFGVKICKYWMSKAETSLSKEEIKKFTNEFKSLYTGNMKEFKLNLDKFLNSKKDVKIKGYLSENNMKGYLCDMCLAQLYAKYNHKIIHDIIENILKKFNINIIDKIECTHNFIDLEDRILRKSAIRSYLGEKILVPLNMRDGVAVCIGKSNSDWLFSCAHGAGRKMSRSKAKENISLEEFKDSMKNVYSTSICSSTIDESPMAYKDSNEILELIKDTCDIMYLIKPKISIKSTK
jgi:RNA-splicing ligase RtcB